MILDYKAAEKPGPQGIFYVNLLILIIVIPVLLPAVIVVILSVNILTAVQVLIVGNTVTVRAAAGRFIACVIRVRSVRLSVSSTSGLIGMRNAPQGVKLGW